MFKQTKKLIIIFFFLTAIFAAANFALAQGADNLLFGGLQNETGNIIGLGDEDPRIIITRIIRIFIGFLGIIAVILIMYAGFLWMTSEGDADKIERAKNTLKNAVIGLVIILASFAIATFILNRLMGGTGGGPGAGGNPPSPGAGLGALGSCSVESVYPEPEQKDIPRNMAMIIVSFKEEVKMNTLCDDANGNEVCDAGEFILPQNVRIFKDNNNDACSDDNPNCDGNVTDVEVQTNDNKTIVFLLNSWLGSPSEEMWYNVRLTNDIEKLNSNNPFNNGIFSTCNPDYLLWRFKVSTKIDLTPPQIKNFGVFPAPDNYKDDAGTLQDAAAASGSITVASQPNIYKAAKVNSAVKNPSDAIWDGATATVSNNCTEDGNLNVSVSEGGVSSALYRGATLLGAGNVSGKSVNFGYCSLILTLNTDPFFSKCADSACLWTVNISSEIKADTLTVGGTTYVFGSDIEVGASSDVTVANIAAVLSLHSSVENSPIYNSGNIINLKARVAGEGGNNVVLKTSASGLTLNPTTGSLSGGKNKEETAKILGKKDEPRNAVVQINFNEAINPLTASGNADDVYIKIVNLDLRGTLIGKFEISNQYKTVEFISDDLCGVNGCGENIYCLPENSRLSVEVKAASLDPCASDQDCVDSRKNPYVSCAVNGVCQNSSGENYPLSAKPNFDGIMDTALNSLDGNRDENVDGPETQSGNSHYNENDLIANCNADSGDNEGKICALSSALNVCGVVSQCKYPDATPVADPTVRLLNLQNSQGDDYKWSFFISDKIELDPPVITSLLPGINNSAVSLVEPVKIKFNKIMMSSSLKTGSIDIYNGKEWKNHKLLKIWSLSGAPLGFWITNENLPPDGNPDYTEAQIKHSMFSDSVSYRSQAGSGLKDIYQNCFKPSSDNFNFGCTGGPSCCDGSPRAGESCN